MKIPRSGRTVRDAAAEAIDTKNAKLAGQVADMLRFECGMNYEQVLEWVRRVRPNVSAEAWELLMLQADSQEG